MQAYVNDSHLTYTIILTEKKLFLKIYSQSEKMFVRYLLRYFPLTDTPQKET